MANPLPTPGPLGEDWREMQVQLAARILAMDEPPAYVLIADGDDDEGLSLDLYAESPPPDAIFTKRVNTAASLIAVSLRGLKLRHLQRNS